ncbi:mannan endo-1,4-beta-mannosidase [Capsulimonas corticalis]|uniref:Mannan endo-1,4-beta-mannosidase n=1 Tax=Capsulimonas corticalis TaxID=2219043 RepID=A0A402CZZ6_9BACT|nr:glycosyl hydrolase [Capsulimonas corticalis]BDI33778.1 mannan endo-1,4-beta-mannosidase [Capsulimonas corticalis]
MPLLKPSLALAALLAVTSMAAAAAPSSRAIHLEAEKATLSGPVVAAARPGFTGSGYVTGFLNGSEKMSLTIPNARAGLYNVRIRYSAQTIKGYDLVVNGVKTSAIFAPSGEKFASQDAGNVELRNGVNTVEIDYGWGHYDIDSIDLVPTTVPRLVMPPAATVDPKASAKTRALKAYLVGRYGLGTLSGQYDAADNKYLRDVAGKTAAIFGGDFIEYSPSRIAHGSKTKHETENMIAAGKGGQIVTMSWHWNAPAGLIDKMETDSHGKPVDHKWYRGFYTEATTFDFQKALADPKSPEYALMLRDIDTIAIQLKKMQAAGVPVLWRPLHEAEGGWFWWGSKGPEPFKKLWRLMYDRLTNHNNLHTLIWVYSSGTDPKWYPGDKYVDIVGVDQYPSDLRDTETGVWKNLLAQYAGRKPIALTEFGGVPDIPAMQRVGARWSYFVSWTNDLGPKKNSKDEVKRIYSSPAVINADKLPRAIR